MVHFQAHHVWLPEGIKDRIEFSENAKKFIQKDRGCLPSAGAAKQPMNSSEHFIFHGGHILIVGDYPPET